MFFLSFLCRQFWKYSKENQIELTGNDDIQDEVEEGSQDGGQDSEEIDKEEHEEDEQSTICKNDE